MTEIYHQRRQEQIVKSNEDREFDLAPATDTNTSTILFSDRNQHSGDPGLQGRNAVAAERGGGDVSERVLRDVYGPVSYTHLTLPTKRIV